MYVVLGATGHVGSAVARTLIDRGEAVTVVTRDADKAGDLETRGAHVAVADLTDIDALRAVFRTGKRAFLLNPPADVATDTDVEEHRTAAAIVAALEGSGLEKVVAASTYGAQPGARCGDLTVLYDFEQALLAQSIPVSIQRAAYYMSNWDTAFDAARNDGLLRSFFPAEFQLPMVAPDDIGRAAADLLAEPATATGIQYVEGPARYTIQDVAETFAGLLETPVSVATTPRERWIDAHKTLGFSDAAAASYAKMSAATLDAGADLPEAPVRGDTTLWTYLAALVNRAAIR